MPFLWIIKTIIEVFMRMYNPPHPGTVLREYLGWIGMQAQYDLCQASKKRRRKLARLAA